MWFLIQTCLVKMINHISNDLKKMQLVHVSTTPYDKLCSRLIRLNSENTQIPHTHGDRNAMPSPADDLRQEVLRYYYYSIA